MIGQKNILDKEFSQFVVIIGEQGSGKKTVVKKKFENIFWAEKKVDGVREVIRDARSLTEERVYLFPDADDMTYQAQNALLKIAEEPPNEYTYIVMTVVNRTSLLPTILSRAEDINMDRYSREELAEFTNNEEFIDYYSQPGLLKNTSEDIVKLVKKIVTALDKITLSNTFKIQENIDNVTDDFILISKPLKYFMRHDYRIVKLISKYEYLNTQTKFNFVMDSFFLELYDLFKSSKFKDEILKEVK